MVSVIADILNSKLAALDWIERRGGLVSAAAKANTIQSADGQFVNAGYQYWPVECDVNAERCFEDQAKLKWFVPESSLSAVSFFVDNGGTTFQGLNAAPNRAELIYRFNLKLLVWMNMKRLGTAITDGECYVTGRVIPYIISQLYGEHSTATAFPTDTVKQKAYRMVEVTSISQLNKTPAVFNPFTFASLPDKQALFIWPYDYFALQIQGQFIVNRFCLADLYETPFVPETEICLPGEPDADYRVTTSGQHRETTTEDSRIIAG